MHRHIDAKVREISDELGSDRASRLLDHDGAGGGEDALNAIFRDAIEHSEGRDAA